MGDENRYFPGDAPELRERLDRYLAGLGERLGKSEFAGEVAFLLLAGGYGRGEGGIFEDGKGGRSLYNDLEFYLVLKSGASLGKAERWCGEESHAGEHETGIEVEFKVLALGALRGAGPSMFYYDLLAAHRLVFGDAALVAGLPDRLRDGAKIPAHEAARLLLNRGTGLFFSKVAMEAGGEVDKTFVERNHAKARLAFGDVVLTMNGKYTWSCRARHAALGGEIGKRPGNFERLVAWHETAVEFKFHPRHEGAAIEVLAERQRELVAAWRELFLWVESIRLGREFRSAVEYAGYKGRLFPEFPVWRNVALHVRDRLRRGGSVGSLTDYPRGALQRALGLFLEDSGDYGWIVVTLGAREGASEEEAREVYRKWWRFYN